MRWNHAVFLNGNEEPSTILIDTVLIIVAFQEGIKGYFLSELLLRLRLLAFVLEKEQSDWYFSGRCTLYSQERRNQSSSKGRASSNRMY